MGTSTTTAPEPADPHYAEFCTLYRAVVPPSRLKHVFLVHSDLRLARRWTHLSVTCARARPPCVRGRDPSGRWADVLVVPAAAAEAHPGGGSKDDGRGEEAGAWGKVEELTPEAMSSWVRRAGGADEREVVLALVDVDSTTVYMRLAGDLDHILRE